MSAIFTATMGGNVDLINPVPAQIDLCALARQTARMNRWGGATTSPYTLAQHSVLVASLCPPEWRIYGLIHDFHEPVLGSDILTPTKEALRHLGEGDARTRLTTAIDQAVTLAAGLRWPWPPAARGAVKYADSVALVTEARDVVAPSADTSWTRTVKAQPLRRTLHAQVWTTAEDAILTMLQDLLPSPTRRAVA